MFDDNLFAKVQYTSGPLGPGPLPPPDLGIYINSISGKIIPTILILAPPLDIKAFLWPCTYKGEMFCTKIHKN